MSPIANEWIYTKVTNRGASYWKCNSFGAVSQRCENSIGIYRKFYENVLYRIVWGVWEKLQKLAQLRHPQDACDWNQNSAPNT